MSPLTLLVVVSVFGARPAVAGQSLRLTPGFTATGTFPSTPYANLSSYRLEFRVHNWRRAPSYSAIYTSGIVTLRFVPSADDLIISNEHDDFANEGNSYGIKIEGRTDFIVRFQRDVGGKRLSTEIWDADGSNYRQMSKKINIVKTANTSGEFAFGDNSTSCDLAFFRLYSTVVPLGSQVPTSVARGDLASWEFEGDGGDTSQRTGLLRFGPTQSVFVNSPSYSPAATILSAVTVRSGQSARLDGSRSFSFQDDTALTFRWRQDSGPTQVTWTGQNTSTPTVSGFIFGTYGFEMTVTDSRGQSTVSRVEVGSVPTDDDGVVQYSDQRLEKVFGPMIRYGLNPWPWADDRHKTLADYFGGLLKNDPDFRDEWNQNLAGTIAVTNGSPIVTGSETQFQTDFCGGAGNTTPAGRNGLNDGSKYQFVVAYPTVNQTARFRTQQSFGRRDFEVASCDSQTQLRLKAPYSLSGSAPRLSYSRWYCVGCWINGSNNVNYYDNVLAFYSLYYRSGLEIYREYAQTLADRWYSQPYMDEGRCVAAGRCVGAPRLKSLAGLMLRATEKPEMWPGLDAFLGEEMAWITRQTAIGDTRENGYQTAFLALAALLHHDASKREMYAEAVRTVLNNLWAPTQKPQGNWVNPTYGYSPWNGYPGTITVTQGSRTVTGDGTAWKKEFLNDGAFWVADTPAGLTGDSNAYVPSFVSATEITLDRPYEGTSGNGKGWQFGNLVGHGTQPFMMGIVGAAFRYADLAVIDPRAKKYGIDIANWLKTSGLRPSTKGLYDGRVFPNCEPIAENLPNCSSQNASGSRFLSPEVFQVLSFAYLQSGDPALRELGDTLYGASFGKQGGPNTDGEYMREVDDGEVAFSGKKSKDFGFLFGFGGASTWPAARLGPRSLLARPSRKGSAPWALNLAVGLATVLLAAGIPALLRYRPFLRLRARNLPATG